MGTGVGMGMGNARISAALPPPTALSWRYALSAPRREMLCEDVEDTEECMKMK